MKNKAVKIFSKHLLKVPFLFFLFFSIISLSAQSRQDLTQKRKRLITEIEDASRLLTATQKDKAAALDQFYAVRRQVQQREQLIETLNEEILLSTSSIERTSAAITSLQDDMQRLEDEYGEMTRQAFRSNINDNKLLFLFSAEGLGDGLKRWRYIQQYDEYRKKQAGLIIETRSVLTDKLAAMEIKKIEQQDLLAEAKAQQDLLGEELKLKNKILKGLTANESRISRVLTAKKKARWKLSKAIENIITAEIDNRKANNRVNTAPTNSTTNKATVSKKAPKTAASIAKSSGNFRNQRGKLPWPVKNGLITRHFGKQAHPIHKSVTITNNGIDIKATVNSKVTAIFSGTVAGVQYVPGYRNTLIIEHGDYYSVYSNLEKVQVKKGETIQLGQLIGSAGKHSQSNYLEVHLEIWKGKQRLNPARWLAK